MVYGNGRGIVNGWHPATKLAVLGGVIALGFLLLTGENESGSSAVAAVPNGKIDQVSVLIKPVLDERRAAAMPDKSALNAMVGRPLFVSTRRPQQEEFVEFSMNREVETVTIQPEPEMTFVGSLIRDDTVLALVSRGYYGAVESIGVGEEIDGWQVLEIGDRVIALGFEDRRLEFTIFD